MLRVTIELVPATEPWNIQRIGEMTLINDGTGTPALGHYTVACRERHRTQRRWLPWRRARVSSWPRENGPWALVAEALAHMRKA